MEGLDAALRTQAELVLAGVDLAALADARTVDCTTKCPACGHGEAEIIVAAEPSGLVEQCLACGHQFVDPTP